MSKLLTMQIDRVEACVEEEYKNAYSTEGPVSDKHHRLMQNHEYNLGILKSARSELGDFEFKDDVLTRKRVSPVIDVLVLLLIDALRTVQVMHEKHSVFIYLPHIINARFVGQHIGIVVYYDLLTGGFKTCTGFNRGWTGTILQPISGQVRPLRGHTVDEILSEIIVLVYELSLSGKLVDNADIDVYLEMIAN